MDSEASKNLAFETASPITVMKQASQEHQDLVFVPLLGNLWEGMTKESYTSRTQKLVLGGSRASTTIEFFALASMDWRR